MALLLSELKELLAERLDEQTLLELLEISAEDIVERFEDVIEENFEKCEQAVEDTSAEEID